MTPTARPTSAGATAEGRAPADVALEWPYGPIMVIGPLPPPQHGVATCMRDIVRMREAGVPLVVVDTADRRGLENIGRLDPMNVWLGLKHGAQAAWGMAVHRPSVVFLFISQGPLAFLRDFLFVLPAVLTRRTLVIQLAGGYFRQFFEESSAPLRALIRWTFRHTHRTLVLAERLRPIFDGLVPPARLGVLPNAIALTAFEPRSGGPRTSAPVVAYLGQISRAKGTIDLLRAVPAIAAAVPDVRVRLAGEILTREESAEIDRMLTDPALAERVELVGVVTGEAKKRFLSDADLFVFPSRLDEGQPYVLLEAMASGLPVVTSDRGGIVETVLPGENGIIVADGDVAAIAAAVVELLRDSDRREAMGRRNRARVEQVFDLAKWRAALLDELRVAHESR